MFETHLFNEACECTFCTRMCEIVGSTRVLPVPEEERQQMYEALRRTWVPGRAVAVVQTGGQR
jgi:hypothetical protein